MQSTSPAFPLVFFNLAKTTITKSCTNLAVNSCTKVKHFKSIRQEQLQFEEMISLPSLFVLPILSTCRKLLWEIVEDYSTLHYCSLLTFTHCGIHFFITCRAISHDRRDMSRLDFVDWLFLGLWPEFWNTCSTKMLQSWSSHPRLSTLLNIPTIHVVPLTTGE